MKLPVYLLFVALLIAPAVSAQELLDDRNGDGLIVVDGFGDSIAFGVGDGTSPGQSVEKAPLTNGSLGYLQRVRTYTGIRTNNIATPGERFTTDGIERYPGVVSDNSDLVAILDGTNDARDQTSGDRFRETLQTAVNVARAGGKEVVLFTLLPTCCDREGGTAFTSSYSAIIRELAAVNEARVADIERAFASTCQNKEECELLNRPEGLHPNTKGHEVIAQTFLATLADINIFARDGASKLAGALGLEESDIVVVPDEIAE